MKPSRTFKRESSGSKRWVLCGRLQVQQQLTYLPALNSAVACSCQAHEGVQQFSTEPCQPLEAAPRLRCNDMAVDKLVLTARAICLCVALLHAVVRHCVATADRDAADAGGAVGIDRMRGRVFLCGEWRHGCPAHTSAHL